MTTRSEAITPGEAIRRARLHVGISQAELGSRIGCSQSAICHLERGDYNATLQNLQAVAEALGMRLYMSGAIIG